MKHNIRQRVINELGQKVTKIVNVQGDLGSGVVDRNGREIFEGDTVKVKDEKKQKVIFALGIFYLADGTFLFDCDSSNLEVIGHVED